MNFMRKERKALLVMFAVLCVLALSLGMALVCAPARALAAEDDHAGHTDWTALKASTRNITGNYYLEDDVSLSKVLQVSSGATATLCLNGHKLTGSGDGTSNGSVIKNYGNLTICDCQSGNDANKHYYTVDETTGQYKFVTDGSTTENYIAGGVITGGNTTSSGGGIYMSGNTAELVLQGGTIAGNYTKYCGGGVHVEAGKFTMNGGAIKGNSALNNEEKNPSDAVYVRYSNASFTMNGGEVAGSIGREQGKIAINGGSFDLEAKESLVAMGDKVTFAPDMEFVQGADGNYMLAIVHKHDDVSFTEFTTSSLNGDALPAGNYYLTEDKQQTREIHIKEEVIFCLNGKRLYGEGVAQMFIVEDGGSLTICDCQSENDEVRHYYTLGENGLYEFTDTQTENYIVGGVISDANGAILVKKGCSFTLQGGTIAGNKMSSGASECVKASQATLRIEGGAIVGNVGASGSYNGGGVYLDRSVLTMTGGRIAENYAGQWGGGVYASASTFTMSGGSIEDNSAKLGGGVYLYSGTMNIGGTPVIRDNAVNDAVNDTDGKIGITMTEKLLEGAQIGLGAFDAVENVVTGYSDFNSEAPNEFFFANTPGDSVVLEEGNLIVVQTYVIHYYLNGTLLGSQTALYEGDTLMTFEELNGTVAEGSKFYGWATVAGSQSASYSDGQDLTAALAAPGEEVGLYAVIAEQGSSFEEQLDEAVKTLNAAIEALKSSVASSDAALQSSISSLRSRLDQAVSQLEKSIADGDKANADALLAAKDELQKAFEAADAVLEGKIGELGEADKALQAAIDAIDAAYRAADEALAGAIEELRAENAAQNDTIARQEKELNSLSIVLWVTLTVAVVALGVGAAGLVFGLKAKKKD